MKRFAAIAAALVVGVGALVLGVAGPASAHILPTSTVVLTVASDESIDAALTIPVSDLEAASGLDVADTQAVEGYILEHFVPTTTAGQAWTVTVDDLAVVDTSAYGTGQYQALTASAHLVAPTGADARVFNLGYDVVVHKVITHTVIVSLKSDWSGGAVESARELGTIQLDTVTGAVVPLEVNLGDGSAWAGFTSMVALGISHIREGTDHQLFLLTLLLPAPLIVASRRWSAPARPGRAVRRIASITIAFTIGHSVTLALGALGLPVPQAPIEALIAVSILVAAIHAIRPIFPGREVLVAGAFGLVHGMAFSATLTSLDLSGGQLALSLLGFNLGIEIMQLTVVALVLPPLIVLSRTTGYTQLRIVAASVTGVAAMGWLLARLGVANVLADAADRLGAAGLYIVASLCIASLGVLAVRHIRGAARRAASIGVVSSTKRREQHNTTTLQKSYKTGKIGGTST